MKKIASLILCGVCAFVATAFVGCEKDSSVEGSTNTTESTSEAPEGSTNTTESTSEVPERLDILDGNFTAITLAELQAFAANIVYTADVVGEGEDGFDFAKEIIANNEGAEFSTKSMGDDEGTWEGYEATGKVFNGKGRFFYERQDGVRGAVVVEKEGDAYCDGETVYEAQTTGENVRKFKYTGDVETGIETLRMGDEVPDLKEWTEEIEGATYAYYLDETDSEYNKIKITVNQEEEGEGWLYGAYTLEQTQTVVFAFDKAYKLKAFSCVGKETQTYTDKTWVWDKEYIARPWSGEIQAPEDLSSYLISVSRPPLR